MRVDPKNNIDQVVNSTVRQKYSGSQEEGSAKSLSKETTRDRVEISQKAADYDPILAARDKVVSELEKGSDANRLRQLKAEIENGTYHVSSKDIAGAILGIAKKGE